MVALMTIPPFSSIYGEMSVPPPAKLILLIAETAQPPVSGVLLCCQTHGVVRGAVGLSTHVLGNRYVAHGISNTRLQRRKVQRTGGMLPRAGNS